MESSSFLKSQLWSAILFGILAILTSSIAWYYKYYRLPAPEKEKTRTSFTYVFLALLIYLGTALIISPFISKAVQLFIPLNNDTSKSDTIAYATWVNVLTSTLSTAALLYYIIRIDRTLLMKIWRRPSPYSSSLGADIVLGMSSWFIAFPLVVAISSVLDIVLYFLYDITQIPDQIAVYYLKMTLHYPLFLLFALLSILIFAPFSEEFLFRGFLQTWLRERLGPKPAIFLAGLCFAFFHYGSSQGIGNITIIPALFVLGCFLGFVYERQRSLIASMSLHATFNLLSVINLIFLKNV